MDFDTYLRQKKIDAGQFEAHEPAVFAEWKQIFEQLSPGSFTAQKKFLLNRTRKKYLLR